MLNKPTYEKLEQRVKELESELFVRDTTGLGNMEIRYQMLFNEMLDGYALHEIIWDAKRNPVNYRFLSLNPAFECLTGLKAEDMVGKTALEVLPSTEHRWIETFGRVVLTDEPTYFENYSKELDKHFEIKAFRSRASSMKC